MIEHLAAYCTAYLVLWMVLGFVPFLGIGGWR